MQGSTTSPADRLERLKKARRQEVDVATAELVSTGYLDDSRLPLVVTPRSSHSGDVDLEAWLGAERAFVESQLLTHGALLFRGFGVGSVEQFERLARTVTPDLVNYVEGSSPRIMLSERVYTSTEYPPEFFVSLHNELSYAHRWPGKIFFFCLVEPQQGGATPIADSRRVLAALPADLVEEFSRKGVRYHRNLHGGRGAGLSWQTVFETTDREAVERYCREGGIEFEWRADGGLRTSQLRPAVIRHPKTGEALWFNQADQFHPSNLPPEVASSLLAVTGEEELPINATFGDGSPLDPAALATVRETFRQVMVTFPWQQGDVLVADNMLVAHGRSPFSGPRRVVVTMGAPIGLIDLPAVAGG